MLTNDLFLTIIDAAPLVSIDLIIENDQQNILLGKRNNRPARNYWFVPGGRIHKNETLDTAIQRISRTELGLKFSLHETELMGAYDHIYDDNFLGEANINTHYVVLGYKIKLPENQKIVLDKQHSEVKWYTKEELLNDAAVHQNTKNYFRMR